MMFCVLVVEEEHVRIIHLFVKAIALFTALVHSAFIEMIRSIGPNLAERKHEEKHSGTVLFDRAFIGRCLR